MRFYYQNMEFIVPEGVYCPAEDSILLAEEIEKLDLNGKKCLEVGCGSGFLSILMAKKGAKVTAADISKAPVAAARTNARENNADVQVIRSDLFEKISGKFDIIVFNPPYLPVDDKYTEKSYDGGATGRAVIERFLRQAPAFLEKNGKIFVVFSSLTGEKEIMEFAEKRGFSLKILKSQKLDWEEIMVGEMGLCSVSE